MISIHNYEEEAQTDNYSVYLTTTLARMHNFYYVSHMLFSACYRCLLSLETNSWKLLYFQSNSWCYAKIN